MLGLRFSVYMYMNLSQYSLDIGKDTRQILTLEKVKKMSTFLKLKKKKKKKKKICHQELLLFFLNSITISIKWRCILESPESSG